MRAWAERGIFNDLELDVYAAAAQAVARIPFHRAYHKEVRCHELARAVCSYLTRKFKVIGWDPRVIDGKWGAVNHSWIEWRFEGGRTTILDVYTPGALPQVQLLDASRLTMRKRTYVEGNTRVVDLRPAAIAMLLEAISE